MGDAPADWRRPAVDSPITEALLQAFRVSELRGSLESRPAPMSVSAGPQRPFMPAVCSGFATVPPVAHW
jgi:hypothetical protein